MPTVTRTFDTIDSQTGAGTAFTPTSGKTVEECLEADADGFELIATIAGSPFESKEITLSIAAGFGLNANDHAIFGFEIDLAHIIQINDATVNTLKLVMAGVDYDLEPLLAASPLTAAGSPHTDNIGGSSDIPTVWQYQGAANGVFGMLETISANDLDGITLVAKYTTGAIAVVRLDEAKITVHYENIADNSTAWKRGWAYIGATHHCTFDEQSGSSAENVGNLGNAAANQGTIVGSPTLGVAPLVRYSGGKAIRITTPGDYVSFQATVINEPLILGSNPRWFVMAFQVPSGLSGTGTQAGYQILKLGGDSNVGKTNLDIGLRESGVDTDLWHIQVDLNYPHALGAAAGWAYFNGSLSPGDTAFMLFRWDGSDAAPLTDHMELDFQSGSRAMFSETITTTAGSVNTTDFGVGVAIGLATGSGSPSDFDDATGTWDELIVGPGSFSDALWTHILQFWDQPAPEGAEEYQRHRQDPGEPRRSGGMSDRPW